MPLKDVRPRTDLLERGRRQTRGAGSPRALGAGRDGRVGPRAARTDTRGDPGPRRRAGSRNGSSSSATHRNIRSARKTLTKS